MSAALDVLHNRFGYSGFRFQQEAIIECLLSGEDALVLHARLLASDTLGFDDDEGALDQLERALDVARLCDYGGVIGAMIRIAVEAIVFDAAAELARTEAIPADLVLARIGERLKLDTEPRLREALAFEVAFLREHPPVRAHSRLEQALHHDWR